jgi:hypothetical protein
MLNSDIRRNVAVRKPVYRHVGQTSDKQGSLSEETTVMVGERL